MVTLRAPANRAEVVEVMARTWMPRLFAPHTEDVPAIGRIIREDGRERTRDRMRTLLAALEAAGVRLVPVEVTEVKIGGYALTDLECRSMEDAYRTVIEASPYAPEGGQ